MKEKGNYFTVDNRIFTFGLKPRDIAVYSVSVVIQTAKPV